jgi:hypothetical protein
MLWSWVFGHAHTPSTSPNELADEWFAARALAPEEATRALDSALNDRLVFDNELEVVPPRHSTKPHLTTAQLWAPAGHHGLATPDGDARVILKWHPFFVKGRAAYDAMLMRKERPRYETLLAYSLDVLHGVRFANVLRAATSDTPLLTAHVAVTLDAMALPLFQVQWGRAVCRTPCAGTGLYAIMERGHETLYDYVMRQPIVSRRRIHSVQWQALYTLYVLGIHEGWAHKDPHPCNVMFKPATGAWVGRDWLYVLPPLPLPGASCRYYVLPARVHHNRVAKLVDFGRSVWEPEATDAKVEKRIRYDFQLLLHGHLVDHPFHNPFKTEAKEFALANGIYATPSRMPHKTRQGNVRVAQQLCDPAVNLHDWPALMGALNPTCGPYASLAEARAAFPTTLVLAGALTSTRRGDTMGPTHDVAQALREGSLTHVLTRPPLHSVH